MGVLDWISARTAGLGRQVADSGQAAVYLRQLLRGNRVRSASSTEMPIAAASGQPPILLIHGYLATRGSVHLLERRLHERGYVVLSYRLGHMNLGDIRDTAALIARKVETLVTQTSIRQVDVIGHSMGGLVGLYYLKKLGGRRRVRKLVMLGTPAGGTWSALLGLIMAPLGAAGQLLPASPFLRELNEAPLPPDVEVVSISGDRDYFAPLESTLLAGVRHLTLPTSHSGLLVEADVVDTIDKILRVPPQP